MNNFDNTKWNARAWTEEMKSKWQEKMFSLGYAWGINGHSASHLESMFYFLGEDKTITKDDDDLEYFEINEFSERIYADVFTELARDNFDEEFDAKLNEQNRLKPKTSLDILAECAEVQNDRGMDYDTDDNQKERSFNATSKAFNAITGKYITPAEVCLMLQIVKDVRQWSQDRLHEDSVLDGVSYASLKGEELYKQYGDK